MVLTDIFFLILGPKTKRTDHVINSCSCQFRTPKFLLTYINITRCHSTNPCFPHSAKYKIWYNLIRNKDFVLYSVFDNTCNKVGNRFRIFRNQIVRHPDSRVITSGHRSLIDVIDLVPVYASFPD